MTEPVALAELTRGELIESRHFGSIIALDEHGDVLFEAGETSAPMYPRSAMKPLQSLGMLRAGLELDGARLALACASHGGQDFHLAEVREMLAAAGLAEADLQNTPGFPLDEQAGATYGRVPSSLAQNCSGKHAAMLATCVANDWPTESYRRADHPLQRGIANTIGELAGEPVTATTVDGCGAPLHAISLRGLATAFGALRAARSEEATRICTAITEYPQWVASTNDANTKLLRAVPGMIDKGGAEGVLALAVHNGPAIAIKVADGSRRALPVIAVAALRRLGVDSPALAELAKDATYGHGKPVGEVRPAAETFAA